MALVTSTEMFKKAYAGGYAIGAFNVNNMEIVQGITEACGELKAPVILQVSKGARAYANHTYLVKLVEAAVIENPDIPIVLHLDHGPDFETCKSCIDGGFTSVMIDGSSHSFEDNIALTRKVVEYAHDTASSSKASSVPWPASRTKSATQSAPTPVRKRSRNSSPRPASTLWPSPSAPATALISSSRSSAPAMPTAFSCRLPSASTSSKRSPAVCRASRSSCTALPPCPRSM